MPCDRKLKPRQTIQQRAEEIRGVVAKVASGLAAGRIKAKIGPQGSIAFDGLTEADRDGVTDACAYRRLLTSGSAMALQAIARAEALAGRSIDRQAVAVGHHSHDGGRTWHDHKG
jgi:hypothetical protein